MSAYSQQSNNTTKTYLLIFLFISLVSTVFYVVSLYSGNWFWSFFGLFISLFQAFVAFYWGDKIALATNGAKQVDYDKAPQIHEMVTNLSKIADIPVPKIYISPDPSANAFACGRDPKNASICLNQGILNLLDKNELEGVIAHELSHIKNRDILVMTVTMVLASVISFIADMGFRIMIFGGSDRDRTKNPAIIVIYIITLLLAPFLAILIQMSVSRQREFLADATAVTFTRYPEGLINALTKLYNNPVPTKHYATSMNHFYIAPPKKSFGEKFQEMFSTHPSIQKRIEALRQM